MTNLGRRRGLLAVLTLLFSLGIHAQEVDIRGPMLSITKEKAIVSGFVPRSDKCIEIRETEIKEMNGRRAMVGVVDAEYNGLWLGVTVMITDASGETKEIDFEARRVAGRFKETYNATGGSILDGAMKTVWIARLWRGKVYPRACAEWSDEGESCEYCQKSGYHMYSAVADAEW